MRRDPICGMTGVIERHGQWFCSEHCIAEFERHQAARVSCAPKSKIPQWLSDPWRWAPVTAVALALIGGWWSVAAPVSAIYRGYLRTMLLPLAFGLFLGGVIDHFIPKEYIIRLLAGSRKRVIVRSTLLGFLASSCSHGCLALTLELYRKGASVPAVVSFLLASPWASMSLTLLLLSFFGVHGVVFVIGALAIALITGLVFQRLDRRGWIESNPHTSTLQENFSIRRDLTERARRYPWTPQQVIADARGVVAGMIPLGRMVLGWVQFGLILSALLGGLVPHHVFARWLGPSFNGLLLTLAFAAVLEVCSEGTAPVAFEIYRQGRALGNAFAFLMGGVVTDYTELGALWTTIGKRTVFWILAITLPLVIATGLLFNLM